MSKITEKLDSLIENFVGDQSTNEEFERAQEFANQVFILAMNAQRDAIGVLKAQLAQYQSDDYVLVPKKPNSKLLQALRVGFYWDENTDSAAYSPILGYKNMIEAQEQHNG